MNYSLRLILILSTVIFLNGDNLSDIMRCLADFTVLLKSWHTLCSEQHSPEKAKQNE